MNEPPATRYQPSPGVFVGRPPCANCGAAYSLHRYGGCPLPYRPDDMETALREMAQAEATGDQARVFVARGNLQRIVGRKRG